MSTLTIINQTPDLVRLAVYKKPVLQPTLDTIAWQIVAPPPGGSTSIPLPDDFQVFAEYSLDPNNPDPTAPDCTVYQTPTVPFGETTGRFVVSSVLSQDRQASGAVINQSFVDLVLNEVRVENNFGIGILSHIQKAGQDVYAPQVIWPGGVRIGPPLDALPRGGQPVRLPGEPPGGRGDPAHRDPDPRGRHGDGDRLDVEGLLDRHPVSRGRLDRPP
jgi:hypothetical protein